ncbi:phosphoserine phosphatase-like isoform X2 [Pongo pygmaeus]|uniref:phosphoserine phosphatase-like isoform X2 n=1 Tax=Pongo abelii TaxID=9601 RepID=UPI0023E1626E|nr:phosphoserine phosphatase-like isoform X2 [Pongo abelii]XP_054351584.1 phosphoserine phosphatase-like isoform X2 [Pongo pygmaeus]
MASASCSPGGALASPEPGRKILPTMVSRSELRKLFYSADAVCFDVDSTVIREEGIGELAKICGVEDAVSEMTWRAMGGAVSFKAAVTEHLAPIQPPGSRCRETHSRAPPTPDPQHKDAFIGFGGNVIRQQVKDNAKWYITDFVELLGELEE